MIKEKRVSTPIAECASRKVTNNKIVEIRCHGTHHF